MKRLFNLMTAMLIICAMVLSVGISSLAATKGVAARSNTSYSPVTYNPSIADLPSTVSNTYCGERIFFNIQFMGTAKEVELYVKTPKSGTFRRLYKYTAKNYLRFSNVQYKLPAETGNLEYFWKAKIGNTTYQYPTKIVKVKKAKNRFF